MTHRVALDLETIPTVEDPSFADPAHWNPFCVALGHQPLSRSKPDVEVLFREDSTVAAEAQLLGDTLDWITSRVGDDEYVLLTYNGESYDLPILQECGQRYSVSPDRQNISKRLAQFLDSTVHVDIIQKMKVEHGYRMSLDDALDEYGIDAEEPIWQERPVTGADMPEMGAQLLNDEPTPELRTAVRRYASSDVEPLFKLHADLTNWHSIPHE
jgi:hypothetical protein